MDRRTLLKSSAGAVGSAFLAGAPTEAAATSVNTYSAPSELKITDMRACTVAANYDYPIIRIDTNQDVYGLGEVRDAGVKGIALILKAHILGKNPLAASTPSSRRFASSLARDAWAAGTVPWTWRCTTSPVKCTAFPPGA